MSEKSVLPRARAWRDVEEAVDDYLREAGEIIALGFVDEVEKAFGAISRNAAAGSPRYSFELDLPGLRQWRVKRYPDLVFYVEADDRIDIWRVLHASRDVPAWVHEPDGG